MNSNKSFFLLITILFGITTTKAQSELWHFDASYLQGAIIPHSDRIRHLITDKPNGILVSAQKKTDGSSSWHHYYNFPDVGFSFHYQNNHNETLGDLYGLYAHYNFYFFQRHLQFRIAQGLAFATNPYDKQTNFRNMAYGARVMPATYFALTFQKRNIWKNIGIQSGFFLVHHSNGSMKAPNTSTNTIAVNVGLTYDLYDRPIQRNSENGINTTEPYRFNFILRSGVNESHIIGMGQKPFYHISAFADKRLGKAGSLQLGSELFLTYTLKELIPFSAVSFPEQNKSVTDDWKRVGIFIGYELIIDKITLEGQVGYYVYDQYKMYGDSYQRLGARYYFSERWFGAISLKTHYGTAEAFELGVGVKL